ncbi:MAG: phenylalanine--tRNA ligase subunit beta [Granulosicoccus sp.]
MKFSEQWLREWINPPIDTDNLASQLTFLGLEVDEVQAAAPEFIDVVVARIEAVEQHPDADRLRVCSVNDGSDQPLQVVCGAPNARAGLVTALARVGGQLPDGTRLRKAKLRGVESFGMLCSASELGLSEEASGIMELPDTGTPGVSLVEWLELNDSVIDIELTPDRGDCLSIRGIARDLSAKNDLPISLREITDVSVQVDDRIPVTVQDDCACVRYAGRVVRDIDLQVPTPVWMVERLRRSGIRSINAAVDVTNYVMLEIGQPMHAFDLNSLQGGIQVRHARPGERLTLLDGRDLAINEDTTIIADNRGAIGIAGIMGGDSTGVTKDTRDIYFESALFLPEMIAGKPRRYASHTESAHRFERGVDPRGQREALEYATGLLNTIAGGEAGPVDDWQHDSRMPQREQVQVRDSRLQRILGISPSTRTVQAVFERLGIASEANQTGWLVTAPSYRYDLAIEEDYIEEVARVIGYDSIPRTFPSNRPAFKPVAESSVPVRDIRQLLVNREYQEVISYSFVSAELQDTLRPDLQGLSLANPISSELAVMRTTLTAGLLNTFRHNYSRQVLSMRLFETGLRFLANPENVQAQQLDDYILASHGNDLQIDNSVQQQMLAGLVTGREVSENWNAEVGPVDFFSIKGDVERLFTRANAFEVRFEPCDLGMLHPGQRAGISVNGESVGYLGALSPALRRQLDIEVDIFVFELSLSAVLQARVPKVQALSRFPGVRRDLALLVDESVSYRNLRETVIAAGPASLREVHLFDVYRGDNIEKGKKSMALGLILQDFSRTLEDKDIDKIVAELVDAAANAHGAVLRV